MSLRSLVSWPVRHQFAAATRYSQALAAWDGSQTAAIQLRKLQAVWEDCVRDVPYYMDLVAAGNAPRKISSWNDFNGIPVLDRAMLKENASAFQRLSGPPDSYVSTAGSTGQPVKVGQWRFEAAPLRIAKLVPWIRLGYSPDSRIYLIWGHSHLLGTGWRRYWNHAIRKAKDWVLGYRRVDAYTLNSAKAARIAREIIRLRPVGVIGYAAVLDLFARYAKDYHSRLRGSGVQFVMSCAEPPPRPDTFSLLRALFGCPILQEFGGVDFGHVGAKLDEGPFRVFPDINILEGDSTACEDNNVPALVTSLYRRYTPLIRYRQGDLLCGPKKHPHGHVFEFDELIGRLNDVVTMADGVAVHSVALIHCFKEEDAIYNVQLAVTDAGPRFRLVVRERPHPEVEARIRTRLSQIHSSFATAAFDYVTDLPANRAGKRRWFIDERSPNPRV